MNGNIEDIAMGILIILLGVIVIGCGIAFTVMVIAEGFPVIVFLTLSMVPLGGLLILAGIGAMRDL